jgi:type IV secretory pathway VirB10-like protein
MIFPFVFPSWMKTSFFRVFILLTGVGVIFGSFIYLQSPASKALHSSSAAITIPTLDDLPGNAKTPAYSQSVEDASKERIKTAEEKGSSAITTPLLKEKEQKEKKEDKAPSEDQNGSSEIPSLTLNTGRQKPDIVLSSQGHEGRTSHHEQIEALSQLMQARIQEQFEVWKPVSAKIVTVTEKETPSVTPAPSAQTLKGDKERQDKQPSLPLHSGEVLYGTLETEANSDLPSPVIAKVLSGALKGATVMGQFKPGREALMLEFHTLTWQGQQAEIEGVAVDPHTSSFGLATDVNHHYFERMVWPMAAAFISGYGDISRMPSTRSRVQGLSETVETRPFSPHDKLASAAGKGAETLGRILEEKGKDLPNTIVVAAGTEIGILLLKTPSSQRRE